VCCCSGLGGTVVSELAAAEVRAASEGGCWCVHRSVDSQAHAGSRPEYWGADSLVLPAGGQRVVGEKGRDCQHVPECWLLDKHPSPPEILTSSRP
jgi:hypothetical protein